jgi:hypothetical protein
MEQLFFSQKNYTGLYDIVRSRIQKTTNYDIALDPKWNTELSRIMQHLYTNQVQYGIDPKMPAIQKTEVLSRKVIQVASQTFVNELNKNRPVVAPNQVQQRTTFTQQFDNQRVSTPNVFQQQMPSGSSYVSPVMNQPQTQYTQYATKDVMRERYDQLSNQYNVQPTKPESINFADANYNAVNNSDIQSRFDEIRKQRESEMTQVSSSVPVPPTQVYQVQMALPDRMPNASSDMPLQSGFASQFEGHTNMVQSSQQSNEPEYMSIFNSTSIDPKNIVSYKDILDQAPPVMNQAPEYIPKIQTAVFQSSPIQSSPIQSSPIQSSPIQSTPIHQIIAPQQNASNVELEVVKKNVADTQTQMQQYMNQLVNLTEKWTHIDLSNVYQTILNIPEIIRQQQNQPLITHPTNLIVSSSDRDFTNTEFSKYHFRVVFGEESAQTVSNYTSNNLHTFNTTSGTYQAGYMGPAIKQMLRNVVSIKLRRVVIPQPLNEVYYPEPYYLVAIDEFDSNIISTSKVGHRIACKIHYDDVLTFGDRKYLYYKNDDDDLTMFYPSPLSKLDRMTLRLLTPDGESVMANFNDSDIATVQDVSINNFRCNIDFYNNTFAKDKLLHLDSNTKLRTVSVAAPSYPTGNFTINTNAVTGLLANGDTVVNLSNQISYIFEVRTQEPDPTAEVRPII